MKNLIKAFALTAVLSGAFVACDSDPCKDVVCGAQGACNEGVCVCNTGYEKDTAGLCNTAWSKKFAGNYNGLDIVGTDSTLFVSQITEVSGSLNKIRATNLGAYLPNGFTVDLDVISSSDVRAQSFTDATNRVWTINGSMAGNVITLNYTVVFSDGTSASGVNKLTKQ